MVGTITKQGQITMWLILGGEGQLGLSLQLILGQANISFQAVGRSTLDICDLEACIQVINELMYGGFGWDIVLWDWNAADQRG